MNHKVLLADDSVTIQKVIKITLANQPYDITDCSSEEELFKQLPLVQPRLVFLDFNLSDKHTGYELTSKILSTLPGTKVLLLLGTFDTVDDSAMEKCGASDKIVKPFDSNKFIAICKRLVDLSADEEEIPFPKAKESKAPSLTVSQEEDQWKMNHSVESTFIAPVRKEVLPHQIIPNPLNQEVSDWGMSVPNIIHDDIHHDKRIDLPPVIGEVKSLNEHRTKVEHSKFEVKFPQNDDLDYPSFETLIQNTLPPEEKKEPTSKLLPIENLKNPEEFQIEHSYSSGHETDIKSLEAQIRDEVEDNLWQVDEFEELKKEVSSKMEEVKSNFQPTRSDFDESLFKPLDDGETIPWNEPADIFSQAPSPSMVKEDSAQLEALVKKYVQEYMDKMFQKNVEKIAWEVIPDLAENLIRQELNKISHKIVGD